MRCLLLACLLLGGCTMHRGHITVVNLHGERIHRLRIDSPDFQREIHGLEPEAGFTIYEDISFRRPWRFEVELDDGRSYRCDSADQTAIAPRMEIRMLDDDSVQCIPRTEKAMVD